MIKALLLSLLLFSSTAQAKMKALLSVPLFDGTKHHFAVNLRDACSFKGVSAIESPEIVEEDTDNVVKDKLNEVQKKIALKIKERSITPEKISFVLNGSQNVTFEYTFKNCELQKAIVFNEKRFLMDTLDIEYDNALGSPVVQKINVRDKDKNIIETLYPTQLEKQIASYEFILGPVVNAYTNIRFNNEKTFLKNHPVIKPIPGFLFRYGPLFLNRDGLGSLVFNSHDFTVIVVGVLKGEALKSQGLDERKQSFFAGGILKYSIVEFTYYNDFIKDKGYNAKLNFTKSFHNFLKWKLTPSSYVQYFDDKYVNYYFGLNERESLATGLKVYRPKHTLNYGVNFEVNYMLDRWTFIANIGEKWYGSQVHSSPTVVRKNETRGVVGVLYKIF